ncbi:serine hydrolase domain-containing protein [Flavihumibacter fluvii]|uniref:serine hydrolase domain-containing protein n=1 Tax=Flavihumibacter fluvii TaxID=2838157 RepID=UPI001BDEE024|nr:serine hydrolase domain-containing protein [Flavihumibacter fluvii]ULQ51245.1 beta-lactamase family protein [Flavihumibacter fluvii]
MKKILLTGSIILYMLGEVLAQPLLLTPGDPEKSGCSKAVFDRLDNLVQQYIDSQWIAGATMIVVKNGTTVYHQALGFSDLSSHAKMKKDNIFRIASQTKAITSVGVMVLLEQGKVLLDDPISKYIPAFQKSVVLDKFNEADSSYTTIPAKRPLTIRDLLTHTSGIGYAQIGSPQYTAIAAKAGVVAGLAPSLSLADQVDKIAHLPLEFQPGERWGYGLNIDVLGHLIERVSKQPLDKFFRQYILDPLGMNDTWFYLPADRRSRLVALHGEDSTGKLYKMVNSAGTNGLELLPDYPNENGKMFAGGAGLVSTAYDYAVFMQMILNGGTYNGKRIISANSVRLMTTNQIGDLMVGENKFGLGFAIYTPKSGARLGVSPGSFDWGGAFSSSYWIDPEKKIVAQMFINQFPNSHEEIHNKFKVQVYSSLKD